MSTASDRPENQPEAAAPSADPTQQAARPQQVRVDDSKMIAMYANFCRVTGTPEELIIDFGLSTDPVEGGTGALIASKSKLERHAQKLASA